MSRTDRYEYQDWNGFGERTKKYRVSIGLTKEKFAGMINRSENYVSELEKGNSSCSVHTLYQISQALKVSSDSLLYEDSEVYKYKKDEFSNKEILKNIIDRCNEEELAVIKDLIVAAYPNLDKMTASRKIGKKDNSKK
ncbi:MAG: helix-turn-helix transcriptional regulator [Clostridia bacterium]|nr:helix-turn-helix transcriptional regulator [Clostridia bacterium]